MNITYRPATPEDLPECVHVFDLSVADVRRRHNMPSPPKPQSDAARLALYHHLHATGIFHVAQQEGRLVGFASAILREKVWFLSGFWVLPEFQRQHVGMPLLRNVWEAGREAGATTYFVWASPDLPAISAYLKIGMLPGAQIFLFEGSPKVTAKVSAAYTTQPLTKAAAMALDKTMRGTRREEDHEFFMRHGWQGTQVLHNGVSAGYYYQYEDIVGPAAWTHPRHADSLLALACRDRKQVALGAPGMNHDAIQFAFKAGLRLVHIAHLLMSAPVGELGRYLPSGPGLF
jgi:GNAT superfamily N-acetyltransferase